MDQVTRLQQVLADHPYLSVTHQRHPSWVYVAVWSGGGQRCEVRAGELSRLLDEVLARLDEQRQDGD